MITFRYATSIALLLLLSACGKSLREEGPADRLPHSNDATDSFACSDANRLSWQFTQPQPTQNRSVDLLFVVDTSASLKDERSRIAKELPAFVAALDVRSDVRIAVMPAHGGASSKSGKLNSAPGTPLVLDTGRQTVSSIQSDLRKTLEQDLPDQDEANGEMMMYSLTRGLQGAQLTQNRAHGFFRTGAALSVVFISDENDACFPPELKGYTSFPDFAPSARGWEGIAYRRYCLSSSGQEMVTPASTYASLLALTGGRKLSLGAITHHTASRVPVGGEDAIGHGLIELVRQSIDGQILELSDLDYSAGLSALGNIVSKQLLLLTRFDLSGNQTLANDSLSVKVDGKSVPASFDPSARAVQIHAGDAGGAGSQIQITACAVN